MVPGTVLSPWAKRSQREAGKLLKRGFIWLWGPGDRVPPYLHPASHLSPESSVPGGLEALGPFR